MTPKTIEAARRIPPKLSGLVQELELERPQFVTLEALREMVRTHAIGTKPRIVAHRLRELGWLLDTGIRGVWEFAPADRAGALSSGDPFLTLRAALAREDLGIGVALGSALWLHNLADRFPDPHEVAAPRGTAVWQAVSEHYRVVRHKPVLEPVSLNGLPVHHPATILVHLAERPTDVGSWASVMDALPRLVDACPLEDIRREISGRAHATRVRLAYLLQSMAPKLIEALDITPSGKVWFGPRGTLRRHDARWNVADTILPIDPRDVPERS